MATASAGSGEGMLPLTSRPLVVELVGLPGAGKTSVARGAAAALERRGWTCGDRSRIGAAAHGPVAHMTRLAGFYLWSPSALIGGVRLGLWGAGGSLTGRLAQALRLFTWSYRLNRAARLGSDVVILDQGPVQAAWSLMLHHGFEIEALGRAVRRILDRSNMAYALVWLEVDPALATERVWGRDTSESSFDYLSRAEALSRLEDAGPQLRTLYQAGLGSPRATALWLDGSRRLAEISGELVKFIRTASPELAAS